MQSIARRSPFGWTLVKGIEDDPEYNKADLGIDSKEVRAYEKVLVSYNNFNFKRPRPNYHNPPTPYKDHRLAKMGTGGTSGGSGGGGGFPKASNNHACYNCKVFRKLTEASHPLKSNLIYSNLIGAL